MHILVVSQFWPPEMGAPAARFYDFGRQWVANGHRVSVITAFPNFPSGVVPRPYRGRAYQHEVMDGIDVYRTYIFPSPKSVVIYKGLTYLSWVLSASLFILLTRLKYDVVIATSPPPLTGLPGVLAAFKRGVALVFDVRDLWPEGLVLSGELRSPLLIGVLERMEMMLYRLASLVTVVTNGKRQRLVERGVPAQKLTVVWNGVDLEAFDRDSRTPLPHDFDRLDPNAKWLVYAGVFNLAQGLDVIPRAADALRSRRPDLYEAVQFVLIGDGARREQLLKLREDLKLDRVEFLPIQPRAAVFSALRRAFAVVITLRPRKDEHTVPSKIFESLASERPVVLSATGEVASLLSAGGGGRTCPPGDASAICTALVDLLDDTNGADDAGRRGRAYVAEHFDRRKIAAQFLAEIERAVRHTAIRTRVPSRAGAPTHRTIP